MNGHVGAIRDALQGFAASEGFQPSETIVRVWPSVWPGNVHAIVSVPSFEEYTMLDRQKLAWDYLKQHLAGNHITHLTSLQTLAPSEWNRISEEPIMAVLTS